MSNKRLKIGVTLLALATILALVKPTMHLLLDPGKRAGAYGLDWDYGVPTQWYGSASDARPRGVQLPENSIGLDFLMLDTYVRCKGLGSDLYGSDCEGDPFERPFAYPPLLTAAFFWIPFFTTAGAVAIWSIAVLGLFFANGVAWGAFPSGQRELRLEQGAWLAVFLLTISYPTVFAFERGNTEVLVLTTLSLAAWALVRRQWFWAGFMTALAAMTKIYPVLTWGVLALLALALLFTPGKKKEGTLLAAGSALGFVLPFAAMPQLNLKYFFSILPWYDKVPMFEKANCSFCQSWPSAYGTAGYVLAGALLVIAAVHFTLFARRYALHGEPVDRLRCLLSFALAVAIPVYVPSMTYDYRLIMLAPLFMMCLFWDAPARLNVRGVGSLVLLAGFAAPRWLEGLVWARGEFSVFLMFQTVGLIAIGFSLAREVVAELSRVLKNPSHHPRHLIK